MIQPFFKTFKKFANSQNILLNKKWFEKESLVQETSVVCLCLIYFLFFALFRGKRHSDIINKSFVGGKMVKVYWPFSNLNVFLFMVQIYALNNMLFPVYSNLYFR